MKKLMLVMLMAFAFITTQAQRGVHRPGEISVGVRSTNSLFSGHSGPGVGFGGQMRLRLLEYVNTEWFADHITSGIGSVGNRTDYHIGWSVLFYTPFAYTGRIPLEFSNTRRFRISFTIYRALRFFHDDTIHDAFRNGTAYRRAHCDQRR
ncbi:MAG: hypothetical protein LW750_03275 [Bacteroidetes bacterium]|nr:hypothetical protein [Bacteroidota bacterium]